MNNIYKEDIQDAHIVDLLKRNNEQGIYLLNKKYADILASIASENYNLDRQDTTTVVTDTFIKILKNINNFEYKGKKSFFNWTFTILKHTILDQYKENIGIVLDVFDESNFENKYDADSKLIEKKVLKNIIQKFNSSGYAIDDRIKIVNASIEKLSEKDQIILYCYLNTYKYKEISEITGIEINNLRVRTGRIIKEFIKHLQDFIEIDDKDKLYHEIRSIYKENI